jgi:hypothetical protein
MQRFGILGDEIDVVVANVLRQRSSPNIGAIASTGNSNNPIAFISWALLRASRLGGESVLARYETLQTFGEFLTITHMA